MSNGDVLRVGDDRLVRVTACCRVDGGFGLLVQEGIRLESHKWSSKWSLRDTIQFLVLGDHELSMAALWKDLDGVLEIVH